MGHFGWQIVSGLKKSRGRNADNAVMAVKHWDGDTDEQEPQGQVKADMSHFNFSVRKKNQKTSYCQTEMASTLWAKKLKNTK